MNADWFVVQGGDGFHCKVDPDRPEHRLRRVAVRRALSASTAGPAQRVQHPAAARRRASRRCAGTGTRPLHHQPAQPHTRLYFAANRLFRSDDRGDSWKPVSPDLTRQIDRNKLAGHGQGLGRRTPSSSTSRPASTATVVALAESPKQGGPDLRRHRRRADPGHRGRRQELAEDRQVPRRAGPAPT